MTHRESVHAPTHPQVLIAGAGPTGLMLAVWLARLGVTVRIADPKRGPVEETRAISLQARTLEVFDQLGLGEEVRRQGWAFETLKIYARGQERANLRLGGLASDLTPHPTLFSLSQDRNEAILVDHLHTLGVQVDWQTEVTGCTQDDQGVSATLSRDGRTEHVRAQYIAACDGSGSPVRKALGIGQTGGTYQERFYVADVDLSGTMHTSSINISLAEDHFTAFLPILPELGRHRVVGQLPLDAGEHVDFEQVRPEIEAFGLAKVDRLHWFASYRIHHRVADTFQLGRAFVLGDAGHVHTPVGGQGMNTGLGDASNLAWKLAQALRGRPEALSTYEAERRPFALALVNTTDRLFTGLVAPSPFARFLRLSALPTIAPLVTRFERVRLRAFMNVSQLRLHYAHSPLSAGRAGKVKGGMRLPWVTLPPGRHRVTSNFEALKSLSWQVHVYGIPTPSLLSWCEALGLRLHVFAYTPQAARGGLREDAIYLVRPDGYVGLAQPEFDRAALDAYAECWLPSEAAGSDMGDREFQFLEGPVA
jgi:2-polyprenyl-6-methoxyphenol hydroxylase-like FAD-dependent oxidoreductase